MTIAVTGATGGLGRHVLESLIARGVEPTQIVAIGRSVDKLADLADQGVRVVAADYADQAALAAALDGVDQVLLISGLDPDRVQQHQNVIDAAARAGVSQLVYTSAPHANTTDMLLAADHTETERRLVASGLPTTVLRNAWYVENYTGQVPTLLEHGMVGAAADGLVSVALRREYAEAAAVVLTSDGHVGQVYELGGTPVSLTQVAAAISSATGETIQYTDVDVAALRGILVGAGVPEPAAAVFADVDRAIGDGLLAVDPSVLAGLLGRPVTPLADAVAEALSA